ncbi:hypothetical protein UCDDA912_g08119 [Diaporthe ampelina]|uniref:Uncharacterized protein n=1 Tax=Diaporthe ampelina TaxID=1214573 RepID=A0A0G2FCM6_9PEZI|nr:hypothetical protein UCDDA912_g08119 [Diaporthe ampelina]
MKTSRAWKDGPRLTLQHVNILERVNSSRVLQYESGGETDARAKMLRVWRKPNEGVGAPRPLVTLGFYDRVEGWKIELDVRLAKDAKSFLDVYEDVHPDEPSASPAYPPSLPPLSF